MSRIPPPPPGFVIQQPAASSPPPPPPGFVVEGQAPQPEAPQEKIDWSQPPTVSDFGRSAGVLARDVLEGGGGLFGIVVDPLAQGLGMITGTPSESLRGSASRLADFVGLPKPQNSVERTISGIQQALVGGGGTLGIARGLAGSAAPVTAAVGRQLGESAGTQLVGAATGAGASGIVREEGGGAGAQAAAGLLGALAPTAGPAIAAEGVRRLVRGGEAGRQQMAAAIDDFAKAGTTPTLGQVAPQRGQVAEGILRNTPGAAPVIARRLDAQAQEIAKRVDDLANQLSPAAGAEKGGAAIVRGIAGKGGFMDRFRATSKELYDEVSRLLPKGASVPAQSTQRVLGELTTPIAGAENTSALLQNSQIASIAKAFSDDLAANGGAIPYDSMKRLRTQVGELMGDTVLSPDTSTRQLEALYGAMSDDLTEAAKAIGNPAVTRAVTRANRFYHFGQKRVEALQNVLNREDGGPEAVYKAMFSNSREGGTRLRRVMQSLNGPEQKDFAAATLRRLGRANPNAQDDLGEIFSPETFLSNWNKMSPEAKNALFDRFGSTYRSDLDRLAAATSKMRDAAETLKNSSGTAPVGAQVTAFTALGASILSLNPGYVAMTGGTLATANLGARAFTNPRLVRWMAQQTQAPAQAVPAAINQLAQIAKDDPDAAELLAHIRATQDQPNSR